METTIDSPQRSQSTQRKTQVRTSATSVSSVVKKQLRYSRLIARALRIAQRAYDLMERKRLLLEKMQAAGLALNTPVELENGEQYQLIKPEGRWVYFPQVELKKVPKFKRQRDAAPIPAEPDAANCRAGIPACQEESAHA